jgi:hypothetical protein
MKKGLNMTANSKILQCFYGLAGFSLILLTGCLEGRGGVGADPNIVPTTTTTTVPSAVIQEVRKIVSVGAGQSFNSQTATRSDLEIDPVFKTPGVVYFDRSFAVSPVVGALKYASMNAQGAWDVEIVDTNSPRTAITNTCAGGANSANCIGALNVAWPAAAQAEFYDLAFFNYSVNAQPAVAYAYGTGGTGSPMTGKSIRFALRDSEGRWSIETAVTGAQIVSLTGGNGPALTTLEAPIRAVKMLVDDSNRAHLYAAVYSATATSSVLIYTMRTAAGTWTTPVAVTTTTPSTLTTVGAGVVFAAGTGVNQSGAAWCKYASGGSSTDGVNAILSFATVDNSPAASTQGFLIRCATANPNGSCATWQGLDFHSGCTGAAPCVTTTPASAAATANQFQRSDLAIDPNNGAIYLSYFTAAPSLTAPATLATGILATKSTYACDAGLSSTPWSAVRAHPTAANGTIGLNIATDGVSLILSNLVAAGATSAIVNKLPVAMAANFAVPADQATVEGTTGAYIGGSLRYDQDTGFFWGSYGALTGSAVGTAGNDLKVYGFTSAEVSNTAPPISISFVDQTNFVFQPTALPQMDAAKAPNGTVGYVYFYQEPGANPTLSKVYYGVRGGSSTAPTFGERVVSNSIVGATTFMNGLHPSLAYDSQSNPVVAFLDQGVAANSGFLMVARSANGGVGFSLDRVDGSTVATNNVGQFTSVDVSADDTIGVAYYDFSTGPTGQRLKFAKRTKNGGWRKYVVDGPGSTCSTTASSGIGRYAVMKWTSTGRPFIVYQSAETGVKSLKVAFATEAETSATYTWTCFLIDTAAQGSNPRGEGIDLVMHQGKPVIVHYDSGVGALRLVTCSAPDALVCGQAGASNFSGERPNYIIGAVQSIASKPSVQVTSSGKIVVAFHGPADQGLYVAFKSGSTWDLNPTLIEGSRTNFDSNLTGSHGVLLLNQDEEPLLFYRSAENYIRYYSKEID